MKGIILFPYLQRRVEGRDVGVVPDRGRRQAVVPRRWPREVRCINYECLIFLIVLIVVLRSFPYSCKACGTATWGRGAPTQSYLTLASFHPCVYSPRVLLVA
jgi:hypothetical protein